MEKAKYLVALWALLTSPILFSQIVGGGEPKKEETKKVEDPLVKKAGKESKREVDNQTQLYFNTNWSNSYRKLSPNSGLFAGELGKRVDEKNANFWSFGLGFRNKLSEHLQLSAGLGFVKNGEKYAFVGTDTSFNYVSTYRYVSMPIVLNFTYGKDIQFFVGAGFMPQMTLKYTQEQNWTNPDQVKSSYTVKLKGTDPSFNPVTVSALFNAGVQLKYSQFWSIYLSPEVRYQLSSSYSKTSPFVHKAYTIGFNVGLTYQL